MTIVQLRDHFIARYKLECLKKGIKEIDLTHQGKIVAVMMYDAISEIQSKTSIIEGSLSIPLVVGATQYELEWDYGIIRVVSCNGAILCKKTLEWITKQNDLGVTGDNPEYYAINAVKDIYAGTQFNITLFPAPSIVTNLVISYTNDAKVFNTEFDDDAYSTNYTMLPSMYDKAILFHMVDSMFGDNKPNFDRELTRLIAKQFNGEKFSYKMTGVINEKCSLKTTGL